MPVNTNNWNKIRYTLYQPIYNVLGRFFRHYRELSIKKLELKPSDKLLILGAGTGLDLEFLSQQANITAIDITPAMINKLKLTAQKLNIKLNARVMDGQQLDFADNTFDAVILHLIIAVIPKPYKCIKEVERVLKPGGRLTIMDKFVKPGTKPGFLRKMLNPIANFLFSDINRDIDDILSSTQLIKRDDLSLKASYRIITALKQQL